MGNEDLAALAYEARMEKVRYELRSAADNLQTISEMSEPLPELAKLQRHLDHATLEVSSGEDMSYSNSISDIVADYDNQELLPNGMAWPWPTLTTATRGIHSEEFIVVCGRPKSRKTFIALHIGAWAFKNLGSRVLFISPEMPTRQIMLRWAATVSKLRYSEFKNAELDEEEEKRLIADARKYRHPLPQIKGGPDDEYSSAANTSEDVPLGTEPLFVVCKGTGKGVGFVSSKIEQYRPDICIVDSFYRLKGEDTGRHEADWKVVTGISRALKDCASNEGVAVLGTHQLNRLAEDKVGSLSNLALADAIGQDADLIGRVITSRRKRGPDKSAFVILGGRETPIEGVMINNVPCCDYRETKEITKHKEIEELLRKEQEEDDDVDEEPKPKAADIDKVKRANPIAARKVDRMNKRVEGNAAKHLEKPA